MNLKTKSENRLLAIKYINRLDTEPRTEQIKNILRGEYLSERESKAKISVPEMKPSCIAEVTIPVSSIPTFIADCKSEIIAFPANQREVTAN